MAATSEYFLSDIMKLQRDGVTYDNLVALNLAEYGGESGIKQMFHLDIVMPIKGGFIGGVRVDDTFNNRRFHNDTRLSHFATLAPDGLKYKLFNDGGLNVKPYGYASVYTGTNVYALLWQGKQSRASAIFRPARFAHTSSRIIQLYRGSTLLETQDAGYASMNSGDFHFMPTFNASLNEGETITIKISTTNDEGTIEETFNAVVGKEVGLATKADRYADNNGVIGSRVDTCNIYMFTEDYNKLENLSLSETSLGIRAYTDIRMDKATSTNTPPVGWYSFGYTNTFGAEQAFYFNGSEFTKAMGISAPSTKAAVVPYITARGTIGVEVTKQALSSSVTIGYIYYYDSINGGNSYGSQYINYTIPASAVGSQFDTGIAINKMADYGAFSLNSGNADTPIVRLESTNFDPNA